MKSEYLADLQERTKLTESYLRLVKDAPVGWEQKWQLLRLARDEAQVVVNVIEREMCEAGIKL